jgi:hypothetical protein
MRQNPENSEGELGMKTIMTREEMLTLALEGLERKLAENGKAMSILHSRLAGKVYVLDGGQPCCPLHEDDYDNDCAVCRRLTGQRSLAEIEAETKLHRR